MHRDYLQRLSHPQSLTFVSSTGTNVSGGVDLRERRPIRRGFLRLSLSETSHPSLIAAIIVCLQHNPNALR
jgi:hypothetical protein